MRAALTAGYLLSAVVAFGPAWTSLHRRRLSPFAVPLGVTLAGACEWCVAQALSTAAPSLKIALICNYAIFPGVCTVVIGFFTQAVMFARRRYALPSRTIRLLLIEPVLVVLAATADPWTHGFYLRAEMSPSGLLVVYPGPLYWMHSAYSYLLLTYSAVLFARSVKRSVRGQRRAFVPFFLGVAAPTVGNIVTLTHDFHSQTADVTPILFLGTSAAWWFGERGVSFTRTVPIAYQEVLAALTDAVVVLDPERRILAANPATARLLADIGQDIPENVTGLAWDEVFGRGFVSLGSQAHQMATTANGTVFDVRIVDLASERGRQSASVVVARDVTELERLRTDLVEQAIRDPLTGLYNRRHLTTVLAEAVARARAEGTELAVIMIDIDHFKQVNDRYGHATGDEVLVSLAGTLGTTMRPGDTVARYGGEEFVAVLPGADAQHAADRAEKWRQACAVMTLLTAKGPLSTTLSAGVAELGGSASAEELLQRADEALYAAKAAGRNQVALAPERRRRGVERPAGGFA